VTLQALDDRDHFNELLRSDFVFFAQWCFSYLHPGATYQHNWHVEAIAAALAGAQRGDIRRLLITMPPRHMKSLCVSVIWPAFLLGHDPSRRVILASYGQELSGANLRLLRSILESDWYQAVFPDMRLAASNQGELITDENGFARALSTGGVFTGFGADFIIYDDPMKQSDAQSAAERDRVLRFYQGTLLTRANDPGTSRIVIVMQRVHEDDLAAHANQSGEYEVLCLAAIAEAGGEHALYYGGVHRRQPGDLLWEERFPRTVLETQRREMGDYEFALQYQQSPIPLYGGLIRVDEIQRHETAPSRAECQMVLQSIDTAMTDGPTSDYSVIMTFGFFEGAWRLLDVQRVRLRWTELTDLVAAMRLRWQPDVILIEHAVSGIQLYQHLWNEWRQAGRAQHQRWQPIAYRLPPGASKVERMVAQSVKLRDGFVTFPREAPWLPDLLREIAAFNGTGRDDQVDALSQFIDYAWRLRNPAEFAQRPSGRNRPPGRPRHRSRASPG